MVAPYIQGFSEQLRRVLKPTGIWQVNNAEPRAWQVFSGIKDQLRKEKKTNVVYKIKCDDCQLASYIGETLRSLKM